MRALYTTGPSSLEVSGPRVMRAAYDELVEAVRDDRTVLRSGTNSAERSNQVLEEPRAVQSTLSVTEIGSGRAQALCLSTERALRDPTL